MPTDSELTCDLAVIGAGLAGTAAALFAANRGVRTLRYTYVRNIAGPWLLFDNVRDPFQGRNLCGDPDHAALQRELEAELQGWLDRLGDEFLAGRVYLERAGLTHYREANMPWGVRRTPWTVEERC